MPLKRKYLSGLDPNPSQPEFSLNLTLCVLITCSWCLQHQSLAFVHLSLSLWIWPPYTTALILTSDSLHHYHSHQSPCLTPSGASSLGPAKATATRILSRSVLISKTELSCLSLVGMKDKTLGGRIWSWGLGPGVEDWLNGVSLYEDRKVENELVWKIRWGNHFSHTN